MMKQNNVFTHNGDKYRIVSTFGNVINARKLKSNGRAKMFDHCKVFYKDEITGILTKKYDLEIGLNTL